MKFIKKLFKFVGVLAVVAGVAAGIYYAVSKFLDKKNQSEDCEENYVSCSCCEE